MRKRAMMAAILIIALLFTATFAYGSTSISKYTGTTYTHNSKFDSSIIVNGLDVSVYQKTIDWKKAKADGIDFAIIRIGGRGYGKEGNMFSDDNFVKNIEGAKAAGVMVGVYFFSQAVNELEAVSEAKYTLKLLGDYELDLPIFMDYEFSGGSAGRLVNANLSKTAATKNVYAFCKYIEDAGYEAGLYANLNFLNNTVKGSEIGVSYPIWVAQYYKRCDYGSDYTYWQYTSGGSVYGISAKNDCNFFYINPNPEPTSETSIANASAYITGSDSYTYQGGQNFEPSVAVSFGGVTLTEGTDYTARYVNNTQAGTGYVMIKGTGTYTDYKMIPFTIKKCTDMSDVTVKKPADRNYIGKSVAPTVLNVTDAQGRELEKGLDYTFSVSDSVNVGTAKVTVSFMGNYSGTKTVSYEIKKSAQEITVANAKSEVGINQKDFNLGVSLKFEDGDISYSSSNKSVATVSSGGVVSVKGPGTVTITIKADGTSNYDGVTKTIKMTVTKPKQTVTSTYKSYTKFASDEPFKLEGVKTDGNGKITYESSDTSVVTVNKDGLVTIEGAGKAVITVTAHKTDDYDEGTLSIPVEVVSAQQTVTTPFSRYTRTELDGMLNLYAKTTGDGKLTYTSSDESVAKVASNGRVTVMGPGKAEITVKAAATDSFMEASKVVTLTVKPLDQDEKEKKMADITTDIEKIRIVSFKGIPSRTNIKLSWKKTVSKYGVDYFQIWRSTKKTIGYKKIYNSSSGAVRGVSNSKDVKPDTTYWYKIRGVRFMAEKPVCTEFTRISVKTKK